MPKQVSDVFGMSPDVLTDSYVDRGALDEKVQELLQANKLHITLRGPSKSGKSWLRRSVIADPIVVQCLHRKTCGDLYTDAVSQLDVELRVQDTRTSSFKGNVSATGEVGFKLLSKVGLAVVVERQSSNHQRRNPLVETSMTFALLRKSSRHQDGSS